ncbi:MAG: chloramphenicol phosphotransferase CPT family protein [Candidatus Pristimantibacillus lignocellulolyticus]|uniref:Chloramphenicol phosphotransferase CPT family protein n=1 Tax=Candidatus Pristimantibacillus lignocellulolyticus TaxID=2994561 RepID=A0A9J6ZCF8_9BACL|nr:MAG: chloramphenicol phosphotransferase CPT family protein [Candidatus Pristimantibacillus lignocellulolyticus]
MDKGTIIFLNGITSSGKTSIVEAMQSYSEPFFYVVANDLFENTIGDKHLQTDYWKYLSEVIIMMYHTAKLFSDSGKNVLIDGMLVERPELKPHYEKVKEIFEGFPLEIVEVFCPLDLCRKRNIERGDRRVDQSDEQYKIMSQNISYSCSVDTSLNTPDECAEIIITSLFKKKHSILIWEKSEFD